MSPGHETGENQRRSPDRVSKRQTTQSQPQRFENKRAGAGEEKNSAENGKPPTLQSYYVRRVSWMRHVGLWRAS